MGRDTDIPLVFADVVLVVEGLVVLLVDVVPTVGRVGAGGAFTWAERTEPMAIREQQITEGFKAISPGGTICPYYVICR
jgi:hypothetical protein